MYLYVGLIGEQNGPKTIQIILLMDDGGFQTANDGGNFYNF